jgi:hypothetical protein
MDVLYSPCCGIDIHKKSITVCVLIREPGRKEQKQIREFGTTTAGVCPGNNESAGKRLSGKTRKGSRWLRQKLCQSAWCASRCKTSYFSSYFQRVAAHRGKKRAIVAVSHSLARGLLLPASAQMSFPGPEGKLL